MFQFKREAGTRVKSLAHPRPRGNDLLQPRAAFLRDISGSRFCAKYLPARRVFSALFRCGNGDAEKIFRRISAVANLTTGRWLS